MLEGFHVAVVPEYAIVPVTAPPASATVNVAVVIVDAFIASLNVTVMAVFIATPVAPFDGLVDETVGIEKSPESRVIVSALLPPPPPPPPQSERANRNEKHKISFNSLLKSYHILNTN